MTNLALAGLSGLLLGALLMHVRMLRPDADTPEWMLALRKIPGLDAE